MSGYQPRNGAEFLYQTVTPPEVYGMFRMAETFIKLFSSWLCLLPEVFVRHSFGQRHLNPWRIILACITIQIFSLVGILRHYAFSFGPRLFGYNDSYLTLHPLVYWSFIGLSIWHMLQIQKRKAQNIAWHTRSFGISRLNFLTRLPSVTVPLIGIRLEVTEATLYRFLEPLICYAVVYFLVPPGGLTRGLLLLSILALAIHNNMVFADMRERFLNMMDARIEGEFFGTMQPDGRAPRIADTAGYHVMPAPQSMRLQGRSQELTIIEDEIDNAPATVQPVRTGDYTHHDA